MRHHPWDTGRVWDTEGDCDHSRSLQKGESVGLHHRTCNAGSHSPRRGPVTAWPSLAGL